RDSDRRAVGETPRAARGRTTARQGEGSSARGSAGRAIGAVPVAGFSAARNIAIAVSLSRRVERRRRATTQAEARRRRRRRTFALSRTRARRYSSRRVLAGSARVARRAGAELASAATARKTIGTERK